MCEQRGIECWPMLTPTTHADESDCCHIQIWNIIWCVFKRKGATGKQKGNFHWPPITHSVLFFHYHIEPWTPPLRLVLWPLFYRWENEAHTTLLLSDRAQIQSFKWLRYHAYILYNFPAKKKGKPIDIGKDCTLQKIYDFT